MSYIVRSPRANAASGFAMTNGARVIDSTPPATNRSPSPALHGVAAPTIAASPDAHSRFTVTPATDSGSPASSSAMRATLRLSSPAWFAQPSQTSSISAGGNAGALDRRANCNRGEVVGANSRQRAAVAADGRADGGEDDGARHAPKVSGGSGCRRPRIGRQLRVGADATQADAADDEHQRGQRGPQQVEPPVNGNLPCVEPSTPESPPPLLCAGAGAGEDARVVPCTPPPGAGVGVDAGVVATGVVEVGVVEVGVVEVGTEPTCTEPTEPATLLPPPTCTVPSEPVRCCPCPSRRLSANRHSHHRPARRCHSPSDQR